jgi:hypothetical protein
MDSATTATAFANRLPTGYHIINHGHGRRTMFCGTDAELEQQLDFENRFRNYGETFSEATFSTADECEAVMEKLRLEYKSDRLAYLADLRNA